MSTSRLEGLPVREGLTVGAAAYLGGMVLTFLFFQLAGGQTASLANAAPLATSAYFWSVLHGWLGLVTGSVTALLFSLVPGLALAATGYVLARRSADSTRSGFRRGATVTAGYLSVFLVTYGYIFARAAFSDVSGGLGGVNPLAIVLPLTFTGLLFPVAFGGLGGYLAD